jgi:hypothetical protein
MGRGPGALVALVALALSCTWSRTAGAQGAAAAAQEARQGAAAARRERERARQVRLAQPPAPQPLPAAYAPYPHPPWYPAPLAPLPVEARHEPESGQGLIIAGSITLAFAAAPLFTMIAVLTDDKPDGIDDVSEVRAVVASMFAAPAVTAALCGGAMLGVGLSQDTRARGARPSASATPAPSASIRVGPGVAFLTGTF